MSAETLERATDYDEPAVFRCTVCGGTSRTRLPNHDPDCEVVQ